MHRFRGLWVLGFVSMVTYACSSDSGDGGTGGAGGGGGCSAQIPQNAEFCEGSCLGEPTCTAPGKPVNSCCVPVGEPGRSTSNPFLKRTTDTKDFSDPTGAAPNLDCFDPSGYPPAPPADGDKQLVSLKGVIKTFANGGCTPADLIGSSAVNVEVYRVQRTGDPATDGALGALVGSAVVANDSMPIVEEEVNNCKGDPRLNREYEYPSVPMYTELVVKSYGNGWSPLYAYNLYISAADPDYDDASKSYKYDVRALGSDDFNTIPTLAIGTTISAGNGAIGGEVHDCNNIRLQFARVDISVPRKGLVYFNDDQDDPRPDVNRNDIGTGRTALYSALDIKVDDAAGTYARVAGAGMVPGDGGAKVLKSLGYFDVRVFPNSVTSITLRGLRPFQVP
ncbi:MAG: hypothetical protein KF718_10385 [Polyangiaceae bacterium]|nr:hypothetical protein [Polyangiaceae bacterium]